jgi:hypothetical protein
VAETRRYNVSAIPAQSNAQPRFAVVAGTVMAAGAVMSILARQMIEQNAHG